MSNIGLIKDGQFDGVRVTTIQKKCYESASNAQQKGQRIK
jgi:hypothetical protein